jgi:hypothetical protein
MTDEPAHKPAVTVRIRLTEFNIPPISDVLVLGKRAPIGSEAMRRALRLLHVAPFEHFEVDDDVVEDIIVRTGLLSKLAKEHVIDLIMRRVKPFMTPEEVIHLDLTVEVVLEEQL